MTLLADVADRLTAMRDGLLREVSDAYVGLTIQFTSADLPDPMTGLVVGAAWQGERVALQVEADGTTYTVTEVA
jgi:hypothetical protein